MKPWVVRGSQVSAIGPASVLAALQVAPPLVDEMNRTFNSHAGLVLVATALQLLLGKK